MLKRSLILVHRWLGVALCLVFLLWFPSGIGMMYWDFPSVSAGVGPRDNCAVTVCIRLTFPGSTTIARCGTSW